MRAISARLSLEKPDAARLDFVNGADEDRRPSLWTLSPFG
jgi:hypothetical protein